MDAWCDCCVTMTGCGLWAVGYVLRASLRSSENRVRCASLRQARTLTWARRS